MTSLPLLTRGVPVADVTVLAGRLGFVEGPVWTTGHKLYVTSMNRGRVYEIPLDPSEGEVAEVAETGGGPNCAADARDGSLWVTQTAAHVMPSRSELPTVVGLQQVNPDTGTVRSVPLPEADCPSDCVVDEQGRVWFTDPPVHDISASPPTGTVRRYDPVHRRLETMAQGLAFPNGLSFDAGARHLYVAETSTRSILRYELTPAGLRRTDWTAVLPTGHPDGIAVDAAGGVWAAGSDGHNLWHFDPDGRPRTEIDFGEGALVTSVCFVGRQQDVLVVTIAKGGRVVAMTPETPGFTG